MSIKEGPLASETRLSKFHPSDRQTSVALLIARFALGLPFLYHGSAILFGWFGGPGIHGFSTFTHMPLFVAFLVGLAQFAGGLAVVTGVLARLGAVCIFVVMVGAIFMVHLPHGYDIEKDGLEYSLALLLTAGSIIVAGAGHYTLVHFIPKREEL